MKHLFNQIVHLLELELRQVCVSVCVCVCEREREQEKLIVNIYIHSEGLHLRESLSVKGIDGGPSTSDLYGNQAL